MQNKKLLFVIATLDGSGGAERALTNRINYLVEHFDYEINVVTTKSNDSCVSFYPLHERVDIINIPIDFSKNTILEKFQTILFNSYKLEKPLLDFINERKFDICTSFGSETFLYQEQGYRRFVKIKENRFTYKKLLTDEKLSLPRKFWRKIRFRENVVVQRKMDFVIALTEEDANFWRKFLKKVTVIPNFIDLKNFRLSNLDQEEVIAVGRLEKEKDFFAMIMAFRIIVDSKPNWILNVYGEGSLRQELKQLIDDLNLNNHVVLRGSVKNIYDKYSYASIYMMTSQYEGFPNTMLEAMAHGLPVVAFESVGGVKVLLKDQENGFLVRNRNIEELSEHAIRLIEDIELRALMGEKSRLHAEEYGVDHIMSQWHQFYQKAK